MPPPPPTLASLTSSLRHHRTYSSELEYLLETLSTLPASFSTSSLLAALSDLEPTILTESQILKWTTGRSRDEALAYVRRQVEIVDENIQRVEKEMRRLEGEEEAKDEEGTMDIWEELDEKGNVVSSKVVGGEEKQQEGGLEELEELLDEPKEQDAVVKDIASDAASTLGEPPEPTATPPEKPASSAPPKPVSSEPDRPTDGGGPVKIYQDPAEPDPADWVTSVSSDTPEEAQIRRDMLEYNLSEIGAVVAELNLEEEGGYYGYEGESEDDGDDESEVSDEFGRSDRGAVDEKYRKEMEELQKMVRTREKEMVNGYVPQLPTPPPERELATVPEEERPKKKGVRFAEELDVAPAPTRQELKPDDDDAIPFLVDLLASEMIKNAGPNAPTTAPAPEPKATPAKKTVSNVKEQGHKAEVIPTPAGDVDIPREEETPAPEKKKGVSRFKQMRQAQEDGIEPDTLPPVTASTISDRPVIAPSILERAPPPVVAPTIKERTPPSILKPSVLERAPPPVMAPTITDRPVHEHPRTHSNQILERAPSSTATPPKPPSALDPEPQREEIAHEFLRMKSKMLQDFVGDEEEEEIVPIDENGEGRKMSRFKRARMRG